MIGLLGVIVAVFILKESFKKKNPFLKGQGVVGLFIAPVLQIACMGTFLYDALNPNLIGSNSLWGMLLSFINEQRGSNAESIYYESAATFASVAKICFLITICSAGYLIFKLFDDDECKKSLMHILIGIGTICCCVTMYFQGKISLSFLKYIGQNSENDGVFLFGTVIMVLVFLLWAWYYFYTTLNNILSMSVVESTKQPNRDNTTAYNPHVSSEPSQNAFGTPQKDVQEPSLKDSFSIKADKLKDLKALLDAGVLTQEEFDAEKRKVLSS